MSEAVTRAELREAIEGPLRDISGKLDRLIEVTTRHDERLASTSARLKKGDERMDAIECTQGNCRRERAMRDHQADEQQEQLNSLGERVGVLETRQHQATGWLKGWDWLKGAGIFGALWAAWEILHRAGQGGGK